MTVFELKEDNYKPLIEENKIELTKEEMLDIVAEKKGVDKLNIEIKD